MNNPELILKCTPPRLSRHFMVRHRLQNDQALWMEKSVIAVIAPAGFGKTSLMSYWRRSWLKAGSVTAWFTAHEYDDCKNLLHGIALSLKQSTGKALFTQIFERAERQGVDIANIITEMLAEIVNLAVDTVIFIDEVHTLPVEIAEKALSYLIFNRPANLKIILASRRRLEIPMSDMMAHGEYSVIGVDELRFSLDETIAVLNARFQQRLSHDACAKLHDITEGWPLGLQLAIAAIEKKEDIVKAINGLSGRTGDIRQYFVESLLNGLPAPMVDFLTKIAIVDTINPELCIALTENAQAPSLLKKLIEETPIFTESAEGQWITIHPLARDFLRSRLETVDKKQRDALHTAAFTWLADHNMAQEAARHAFLADNPKKANALIRSCLYDIIGQHGNMSRALSWIERFPKEEFLERPWLKLACGWALALGERHREVFAMVGDIATDTKVEERHRVEAKAIMAQAHIFADDIDLAITTLKWAENKIPTGLPRLDAMLTNELATVALFNGQPHSTRFLCARAPMLSGEVAMDAILVWGRWITGWSYYWEGQMLLASNHLSETLLFAERSLGRRAQITVMVATVLAAVELERDHSFEALSLLANRFDILERITPPDMVILGHEVMARINEAKGDSAYALDILNNLYTLGEQRQMPRLCIASLNGQIRIHAKQGRFPMADSLLEQVDEAVKTYAGKNSPALAAQVQLQTGLTLADLWQKRGQLIQMEGLLNELEGIAKKLSRGREWAEIRLLGVLCAQEQGRAFMTQITEIYSVARLYGLTRFINQMPPALKKFDIGAPHSPDFSHLSNLNLTKFSQAINLSSVNLSDRPTPQGLENLPPKEDKNSVVANELLTSKEREILLLLAKGMSNKEIANVLEVSDQTIKWHIKNLFAKLNAGSRKHVVNRAKMLGVLVSQ